MAIFMAMLCPTVNCSFFAYDYSGYGCSSGKPGEKNLYADIEAAVACVHDRCGAGRSPNFSSLHVPRRLTRPPCPCPSFGVPRAKIILYGQSIGTVPTVDYASKHGDLAGVVLHSPLASGRALAVCGRVPSSSLSYFASSVTAARSYIPPCRLAGHQAGPPAHVLLRSLS